MIEHHAAINHRSSDCRGGKRGGHRFTEFGKMPELLKSPVDSL